MDISGAKNALDKAVAFYRPLRDLQESAEVLLGALRDLEQIHASVATEQKHLADLKAAGLKELAVQEQSAREAKAAAEHVRAEAKANAEAIVHRAATEAGAVSAELVQKRQELQALNDLLFDRRKAGQAETERLEATLAALRTQEQEIRERAAAIAR